MTTMTRARKTIDKSLMVPKYFQLKEILLGLINSGELPVGAQIPSLSKLCQTYGVSTITCRKTIAQLVSEGVLRGEWGKGVFVISQRSTVEIERISLVVWSSAQTLAHPAFSELLRGIITEISKYHYHLVFVFLDPEHMKNEEVKRRISLIDGKGIILPSIPFLAPHNFIAIAEKKIPIVAVANMAREITPYRIGANIHDAFAEALDTLIMSGRRKIALVGFPQGEFFDNIAWMTEFLRQRNIAFDERFIQRGPRDFITGQKLMNVLLDKGLIPDVVIADDDNVGHGVLDALRTKGITVPDQVRVLGLGGFQISGSSELQLSTITVPNFRQGEEAARMLVSLLEGRTLKKKEITLSCTVEWRDT